MSVVPGWYPDPYDDSRARYWDGSRWTNQTIDRAELQGGSQPQQPADSHDGAPAEADHAVDTGSEHDARQGEYDADQSDAQPTDIFGFSSTEYGESATGGEAEQSATAGTGSYDYGAAGGAYGQSGTDPYAESQADPSDQSAPYGEHTQSEAAGSQAVDGEKERTGSGPMRAILIALIAAVVVLGGFFLIRSLTGGEDEEASPDDESSSEAASESASGGVFTASVGDCLNSSQPEQLVDCAESHDIEVIHTFNVDDAEEYPGQDGFHDQAVEQCTGAVDGYLGGERDSLDYAVTYLYPTPGSWDQGDREIICQLQLNEPTTGSVRQEGA